MSNFKDSFLDTKYFMLLFYIWPVAHERKELQIISAENNHTVNIAFDGYKGSFNLPWNFFFSQPLCKTLLFIVHEK